MEDPSSSPARRENLQHPQSYEENIRLDRDEGQGARQPTRNTVKSGTSADFFTTTTTTHQHNFSQSTTTPSPRNYTKVLFLGVGLVAVIVLAGAISFQLLVWNDDDNDSTRDNTNDHHNNNAEEPRHDRDDNNGNTTNTTNTTMIPTVLIPPSTPSPTISPTTTTTMTPTEVPVVVVTQTVTPTPQIEETTELCCPMGYTGRRPYLNCSSFYECDDGWLLPAVSSENPTITSCGTGLRFDYQTQNCRLFFQVTCATIPVPPC